MYTRFIERHGGWRIEVISLSDGTLGGLKEAIFKLTGPGAFGDLRFESGVHRVQRVPATEAQGRIHTSAATVAVLPEADEIDLKIAEQEAERSRMRKSQVSTGDRSAKIRTYNYPQSRVTDHRIGYTTHDLAGVMEGKLDDLLDALRVADIEEKLAGDGV